MISCEHFPNNVLSGSSVKSCNMAENSDHHSSRFEDAYWWFAARMEETWRYYYALDDHERGRGPKSTCTAVRSYLRTSRILLRLGRLFYPDLFISYRHGSIDASSSRCGIHRRQSEIWPLEAQSIMDSRPASPGLRPRTHNLAGVLRHCP